MRGKIIVLILAGAGLAACSSAPGEPGFAGHPLDCGLGFAHSDCAPGTPGYRAASGATPARTAGANHHELHNVRFKQWGAYQRVNKLYDAVTPTWSVNGNGP